MVSSAPTATLVDSNVVLDLLTDDAEWGPWSADQIQRCAEQGPLLINQVVYAEVSVDIARIEELDSLLPRELFLRAELPWEAAFLAAKCHCQYRSRGGPRTTTLPDFFIGAHAAVLGLRLLTRDATRYRTYLPTVELVAPV